MKFIFVPINAKMRDEAEGLTQDTKSRFLTALAAEVVQRAFPNCRVHVRGDAFEVTIGGKLYEIRAEGVRRQPNPTYSILVNKKRKVSRYLWVFISHDFDGGWVVGWCKTKDFYDRAKFYKEGAIYELANGMKHKNRHDSWHWRVDRLKPIPPKIIKNAQQRMGMT